ncbi:MAG: LppX_LprAFG lipoprotein [Nocardioides alkalitolerans]
MDAPLPSDQPGDEPGQKPGDEPGGDDATRRPSRRGWVIGAIIVVALIAAALVPTFFLNNKEPGLDRPDAAPEDVLKEVKENFDAAEGVRIAVTSEDLADADAALVSLDGTAVRPDGFSGEMIVRVLGRDASGDILSVDGQSYAQGFVIFPSWAEVDPEDFNAPDPGALIDPDDGVSGLLTATQDLEQGDTERVGPNNEGTATTYTGTLDASVVRRIIPGADDGDFDVTYQVDDEENLLSARLTGVFYPGSDAMTYVISFSDYGETIEITAP